MLEAYVGGLVDSAVPDSLPWKPWCDNSPYYIYSMLHSLSCSTTVGQNEIQIQPLIVQVLLLRMERLVCNFHHSYTSVIKDTLRKKMQEITLCHFESIVVNNQCLITYNQDVWPPETCNFLKLPGFMAPGIGICRLLLTSINCQTPNSTMIKTKDLPRNARKNNAELHKAGKSEARINKQLGAKTSTVGATVRK